MLKTLAFSLRFCLYGFIVISAMRPLPIDTYLPMAGTDTVPFSSTISPWAH